MKKALSGFVFGVALAVCGVTFPHWQWWVLVTVFGIELWVNER